MPSLRRLPSSKFGKVVAETTPEPATVRRFEKDESYDHIKFIDFNVLKKGLGFPQYNIDGWRVPARPLDKYFATSASKIDFENSLVIFVSHCWMNDGTRPDTENDDQFKLCLEAIEYIRNTWATGAENCYVWIDYSCLELAQANSEGQAERSPRSDKELKYPPLDVIISCCDCILTPLFDGDDSWAPSAPIHDFFVDCNALPWRGRSDSYLSRAWCRLEMVACSNMPLLKDLSASNARSRHFEGCMANFLKRGQRPHIIYGSYQQRNKKPPIMISSLPNAKLSTFHPSSGRLTKGSDKVIITKLMQVLQPHITNPNRVGYHGEVDKEGEMHGHGRYCYDDGRVYEGQWQQGHYHGKGVMRFPDGGKAECEFDGGMEAGLCTYTYLNGDSYYGTLCGFKRVGRGILEYANGDVYEGFFNDNMREGEGTLRVLESGETYEGCFKQDQRHGKGVLRAADGSVLYKGHWRENQRKQRRNSV